MTRLLDHQRRLEHAETLLRDLRIRLREQPETEHPALKETLRLASRDASLARRALTDLITESQDVLPDLRDSRTRQQTNGSEAAVEILPPCNTGAGQGKIGQPG
jgi:hypothetical protein